MIKRTLRSLTAILLVFVLTMLTGTNFVMASQRLEYNNVILDEPFTLTTEIDSAVWERATTTGTSGRTYDIVSADDYSVADAQEHGKVLKISKDDSNSSNYFRMTYAKKTGLVAGVYDIEDLQYVQVDFDVYFPEKLDLYFSFYDSLSGSSTKKDNLFIFKADGRLMFLNGSDTYTYNSGQWYTFHTYFDFENDTYTVYMGETLLEADIPTTNLDSCIVSYGPWINSTSNEYEFFLDNMGFSIPKAFKIANSYPDDNAQRTSTSDDVTITTSNNIKIFNKNMLEITENGGEFTDFEAEAINNVITVSFPNGLAYSSLYEITLTDSITDIYGQTISDSISFVTIEEGGIALTPALKEEIKGAVNDGDTQTVMNNYKQALTFSDDVYTEAVYAMVDEQKPFSTFDDFAEVVTLAATLLDSINNEANLQAKALLNDNSELLFGVVSNYDDFILLGDSQASAVLEKIIDNRPYDDYRQLRIRFSIAAAGVCAPEDAGRASYYKTILDENFNDMKTIQSSVWERADTSETAGRTYETVSAADNSVADAQKHDKVLKISKDTSNNSNYFRMTYANKTGLVAGAYEIEDLQYVQVDFDIYFPEKLDLYFRFYDSLSGSSTKTDNLFIFKADGRLMLLNGSGTYTYNSGQWYTFHTYFDFKNDTYTVYMGDTLLEADVPTTNLDSCIVSFGPYLNTTESAYTFFIDNMGFSIPDKFKILDTFPLNNGSNANVLDDVVISFGNPIDSFDAKATVIKSNGNSVNDFVMNRNGNDIIIHFPNGMDFNAEYEIELPEYILDLFGNELQGDRSFSFKTSEKKVSATIPQIASDGTVTAKAINPLNDNKNIALIAFIYKNDGTKVMLKDEKSVLKNSLAEFSLQIPVEYRTGYEVKAFMCENSTSYKMIREEFAALSDAEISFDSGNCGVELSRPELKNTVISVNGCLTSKCVKPVLITLTEETEGLIYAVPVVTGADGKFEISFNIPDDSIRRYTVEVSGAGLTNADSDKIVFITDSKQEEIKNAVNNGSAKAAMENYKAFLNFTNNVYNDNIYMIIDEQKPFDTFDNFEESVELFEKIWQEIGTADYTRLTELFDTYSGIILKNTTNAATYSALSEDMKNKVNSNLILSSPFAGFSKLREEFDKSVTNVTQGSTQEDSYGGGGSSGGGGTKISVEVTNPTVANSFADLDSVPWAKNSIEALKEKGIISEAANYRPLDAVTREEFVKMIMELFNIPKSQATSGFTDDSSDKWYSEYLSGAKDAGIISGNSDGSFGVGKNITRQDMAVIAYRAIGISGLSTVRKNELVSFKDSADISGYAYDAICNMQQAGILSGMGNGNFAPMEKTNRAQAAVVVYNILAEVIE